MAAKEQLRERIAALSRVEERAAEALRLLDLRDAPVHDEPLTSDDALAEARAAIVPGRTRSLHEAMREFG